MPILALALATGRTVSASPPAQSGPPGQAARATISAAPAGAGEITPEPRIRAMMDQVQTDDLLYHLEALSGEREAVIGGEPYTIYTRFAQKSAGATEGLRKATQYLLERFADWGIPAQKWHFSTYGWDNVVATLPGWTHPERVHILCAHYDSRGIVLSPAVRAPGADDNGSGTVTVLLAARILSQYAFEDTIRFVLFSAEEVGLWGSSAYAQQVAWKGEQVVDVINLDMVAWNGDGLPAPDMDLHARDAASQAVADDFAAVVQGYDLDLVPQKVYGWGATGASDHSPFWDVGIPAILVIEDYNPGARDFNPNYHTADDLVANLRPPACTHCLTFFLDMARATLGTVAHRAGLLPAGLPTPTPTATPTATPTPACPDHLPDGNFEAGPEGTAWVPYSPQGLTLITQDRPHSGVWSAELASHVESGDRIAQTVVLPAGVTDPTLAYWWYLETDEWNWGVDGSGRPRDRLRVQVLEGDGDLLQELEVLTEEHPQGRWHLSVWDLSPYAGQTVQVRFLADTDGDDVSRFFVDDVSLRYCGGQTPMPTATATPTASPTPTATPTEVARHDYHLPFMVRER